MSDLGDRMKRYEAVSCYLLTRRTPVIVRVDGKAFHTWTRGLARPFDQRLSASMYEATGAAARAMQGFKAAYAQSDEVSFLLTDYDRIESEPWMGNVLQKITSVTASMFTGAFNLAWQASKSPAKPPAVFDARAFNVPENDVANYFLWRMKDWERNSVTMYAQSFFSHKQLHGQGRADMHEMLHKIGKNWATDLGLWEKNGVWFTRGGQRLHSHPGRCAAQLRRSRRGNHGSPGGGGRRARDMTDTNPPDQRISEAAIKAAQGLYAAGHLYEGIRGQGILGLPDVRKIIQQAMDTAKAEARKAALHKGADEIAVLCECGGQGACAVCAAVNDLRRMADTPTTEQPHPMLCVAHGGSPACEESNRRHGFGCPRCKGADTPEKEPPDETD